MKKVNLSIIVLSMLVLFGLPAHAQKFHYGIKAGSNFAVQSGIAEYYDNSNIRVGLHAGLMGSYQLKDNMMLQAEVNYEQAGAKSDIITKKYDYVSIPILYDYSFGKTYHTNLRVHLNAGPYVSYLINAKSVLDEDSNPITTDVIDDSNKAEVGAAMGIGLIQPIGKHYLSMDIRLNLGLNNFSKDDNQSHNKMIGLYLGYVL